MTEEELKVRSEKIKARAEKIHAELENVNLSQKAGVHLLTENELYQIISMGGIKKVIAMAIARFTGAA